MGGAAVFVLGPAGAGKSTFCQHLLQHCSAAGRTAHLYNLDPAADPDIPPLATQLIPRQAPSKDIRDLVTVAEVMEELGLGPNGGLIYALETLVEHREWLEEELQAGYEDEFLVVDCPGQIELFTQHSGILPRIIELFSTAGYRPCVVYLLESQFMLDVAKFFAGVLNAASAMLHLAVPHINIISKMDLCQGDTADACESTSEESNEFEEIDDEMHPLHKFFFPNPKLLLERLTASTPLRFKRLNEALVSLLDEFDMVNFVPLDIRAEGSLARILHLIDAATQYSEQLEPKEPTDECDPTDNDGEEAELDRVAEGEDLDSVD